MQLIKPLLVGIAGGSASGKTFLLNSIAKSFNSQQVTIISLDNYYKPKEQQTVQPDGTINFDHPNALDLDKFYHDLLFLLEGNELKVKEYHFNNPNKPENWITYRLAPIVVIEGLFVFYKKEIRKLLNLKVFVEADEHIKLIRRIARDHQERGYFLEDILEQYENHVVPMYRQFVEPTKQYADIIIQNNTREVPYGVEVVVNHLRYHLETFNCKNNEPIK